VTSTPHAGLQVVAVPASRAASDRVAWSALPASFLKELEEYLNWCRVPDPLADDARRRALAPATVKLRRDYIHLAATAACASGKTDRRGLTSLSPLVEPEMYRAILRHQFEKWGKITPYLQDLAQGLIVIASEWVKVPADQLAVLKKLRGKLGNKQFGLTEKNRTILRRLDDPRLQSDLVQLPDTLWRIATRNLAKSRNSFVDQQNALAIDILLHAPLRIENLAALKYDKHVHWPQGRSKHALIAIAADETKNDVQLELELPLVLSNRLWAMRNEIAPSITGRRPETVFVTVTGKPKSVAAIRVGIERTVLRRLGVLITPHQFRHFAAKLILDANPGAYELARQLLGHRSMRTTTRFYAGPNTRRAGRAHAELINRLRSPKLKPHISKRKDEKEG
jgi:integrase